jgi:nucleotide-binding universal stress UspA family protein
MSSVTTTEEISQREHTAMLMPIRTILHPTDYSPASEAAFAFACSLAGEYFSEILVLHVVEPVFIMTVEGYSAPYPSEEMEAARKRLDKIIALDSRVKVRREVAYGGSVDEIVRVAAESKADMIAMGTHGRSGLSRLIMGSVAEGVLRKVACPVLFVKEPHKPTANA